MPLLDVLNLLLSIDEIVPAPNFSFIIFLSGYAKVLIFTTPPAKVPGKSGVNVFFALNPEIIEMEKRSKGTALFSGSGVAKSELFNWVFVYLSPNPLTATMLSTTETPVTLLNASAALESPAFDILSKLIASSTLDDSFLSIIMLISLPSTAWPVTSTPDNCTASIDKAISKLFCPSKRLIENLSDL